MSAKELIKEFGRGYQEKVGELYPPSWGRDLKIFSGLLSLYPLPRLQKLLQLYFNSSPRRVYSIPFFKVELADLIQEEKKERTSFITDNESWRDID